MTKRNPVIEGSDKWLLIEGVRCFTISGIFNASIACVCRKMWSAELYRVWHFPETHCCKVRSAEGAERCRWGLDFFEEG